MNREIFGNRTFRLHQREVCARVDVDGAKGLPYLALNDPPVPSSLLLPQIMNATLSKRDCFVLMPTGGVHVHTREQGPSKHCALTLLISRTEEWDI